MSSALVGLEREGGEMVREGDVDACYGRMRACNAALDVAQPERDDRAREALGSVDTGSSLCALALATASSYISSPFL